MPYHRRCANADGSPPVQISNGKRDIYPTCSPDGKWVYYSDNVNFQLYRAAGWSGKSELAPGSNDFHGRGVARQTEVSADGKTMAYSDSDLLLLQESEP